MTLGVDGKREALAGAGLAFSLGWVWFPWLAGAWQPYVVWGDVGSGGGGTAFLLLLALGFPLGGVVADRLPGGARSRRLCHGVALTLLLLSLVLSLYGSALLPGRWQYLIVPVTAAAYIVVGLYWSCRIVGMPAAAATAAFLFAVLAAAGIGCALAFLAPRGRFLIHPLGVALAWALAEWQARRDKPRRKPTRRDDAPPTVPPGVWAGAAALFAAIGFACGMRPDSPTWLSGLPFGLGACVPALAAGRDEQQRWLPAVAALCVPAAAGVAFFLPGAGNAALAAAEGLLSGLGLILLAGSGTGRRAGTALGACVLLVNCGCWGGAAATGATAALTLAPALAGGAILLLALRRRAPAEEEEETPIEPTPAIGLSFTEEEQRLIVLLAMPDLSNQDIADRLFVSRDTVRYHLKKLYARTGASSRAELVRTAGCTPQPCHSERSEESSGRGG